jgi:hypothetical protein
MEIEWPVTPNTSAMTVQVLDNTTAPASILDAGLNCTVRIEWDVPAPTNSILGGSFRLRAYAESIGPGQEIQIGPTKVVPVVPLTAHYSEDILVAAGTLRGEGELDPVSGVLVSGVYKIIAVLQHLNPGPTEASGFSEDTIRMFRTP